MQSVPEPHHSSLPEIEIADLVWQPAGADAPTLDLRGSTIHIGAGETLLISGASGAGKSTLAAAIAGLLGTLLPGTLSGTLRVDGVDLVAAAAEGAAGAPRELLGQLGFIAAGPAPRHALPRLLDDVALPLESRGVRAELLEPRARAAIASAGLSSDAAERDVASLSGGERAQAAAATALVSTPGLVIADEPLAGLDATRAGALAALLMEQRATRVIVTHDVTQFSAAAVRLHLDHGRVAEPPAAEFSPVRADVQRDVAAQPTGERGAVLLQLFAAASSVRHGVGAVSATLHAGELLLVRGETGSGKSTLLALAAGTLSADAGERHVTASRIRYAPQDPGLLLGARSVHQLLSPAERGRAADLAAALNVADLLDRPAARCSDGERRRLALVVTAAAEPDLLIADEPTLGLDDEAATRVSALLENLAARGAALLVATHDVRLQMRHARVLQHPDATARAEESIGQPLAERGVELARELLTPAPVKRLLGVSNPLTRFGLAAFWFLLSLISPATALAQGAVALPALIVAWSSGVQLISTLRLAAALAPAMFGMVLANLLGGATPEAAFGAGVRLLAFAAGSLVLLRPFEPLRLADAAMQHLRAPFAPTLTLLTSAATLPPLMSEARERRAIRRLAKPGVDPFLLADLFDAAIRAVPCLATALEVRAVRLPSRLQPATALRPSRFGRADLLLILLSAGGLLFSGARVVGEAITLGS
jgi:energy-coupling factor transport system ATP-binding protein